MTHVACHFNHSLMLLNYCSNYLTQFYILGSFNYRLIYIDELDLATKQFQILIQSIFQIDYKPYDTGNSHQSRHHVNFIVIHCVDAIPQTITLAGGGESGKSTIVKQMKILHINGFTEE